MSPETELQQSYQLPYRFGLTRPFTEPDFNVSAFLKLEVLCIMAEAEDSETCELFRGALSAVLKLLHFSPPSDMWKYSVCV